jgi:hypothetical protein
MNLKMILAWKNMSLVIYLFIVIKLTRCDSKITKYNNDYLKSLNSTIDLSNSTINTIEDENNSDELDIDDDESKKLMHLILRRSDGSELSNTQTQQLFLENDELNLFKRDFNNLLNSTSFDSKSKLPFLFDPKLDVLNTVNSKLNTNDIPLIQPAAAQLSSSPFNDTNTKKRKKNFSKLAKSLIIASRMFDKKSISSNTNNNSNDPLKAARSFTSPRSNLLFT